MLGNFRSSFKPLKTALAKPLARTGIHPNLVSFLAVPMALLATYLVITGRPLLALLVSVPASLLDLVDGEVARLQGRQSPFGNYFEAIVDKIVEMCLMLGLIVHCPLAGALALGLSLLVSFAKPRVGLVIITDNRDWPGLSDHSDRMVLVNVAILLLSFPATLRASEATLWLLAAASLVGLVQRILYARDLIAEAEGDGTLLPYIQGGP